MVHNIARGRHHSTYQLYYAATSQYQYCQSKRSRNSHPKTSRVKKEYEQLFWAFETTTTGEISFEYKKIGLKDDGGKMLRKIAKKRLVKIWKYSSVENIFWVNHPTEKIQNRLYCRIVGWPNFPEKMDRWNSIIWRTRLATPQKEQNWQRAKSTIF